MICRTNGSLPPPACATPTLSSPINPPFLPALPPLAPADTQKLTGQMGLFLTSHPVPETLEWFESYSRPEYARQNHPATRDITIPSGPILTPYNDGSEVDVDGKLLGDPFPHSMEPQLRQLGLSTSLVRGVPSLNSAHVLCKKGEKLSSEKCRVLKLLGVQMSVCRVSLQRVVYLSLSAAWLGQPPEAYILYLRAAECHTGMTQAPGGPEYKLTCIAIPDTSRLPVVQGRRLRRGQGFHRGRVERRGCGGGG